MGGIFSSQASIDERVERALRIRELKAEVDALKQDNNDLRREMMQNLNRGPTVSRAPSGSKQPSEVSVLKIDAFVDKLLADPDTNIAFIPDMIERPAQRNMQLFLLKAMAHAIDTSSIQFLGHEIIMRMQPIVDECDASPDERDEAYSDYQDDDYGDSDVVGAGAADSIPM